MKQFNLIDEPWIPVVGIDGERFEIGIKKLFEIAHQLKEVEDSSPLVVGAIYRLLLAIIYRSLAGPESIEQVVEMFEAGLPLERINNYLEKFRDRFYLFHPTHPFGQVPSWSPTEKDWRNWPVLAVEHSAGRQGATLFDHLVETEATNAPASKCARMLLAVLTRSPQSHVTSLAPATAAPSASAILALPIGSTLAYSLLLALVPQRSEVTAVDLPIWEREPPNAEVLRKKPGRKPSGYADLYSWRSRAIIIKPNREGIVREIAVASGEECLDGGVEDPMAAHRIDEKHGRLARKFRSSNIWRDFDSLMPDGSDLAPRVLETTRIVLEFVDEAIFRAVLVIGALSDKAKVVFWRRQTFTLPPFLLSSPEARSLVSEGLRLADDFGRGLYLALSRYYRSVLRHGEAEPRKEDVTALITSSSVLSSFWSVLEVRFPLFLEMIASRTAFDSSRAFWNESVLTAFELAWSTLSDAGEERNPWTIRALVRAEKDLNIKRRELYNAIKQFSSNG